MSATTQALLTPFAEPTAGGGLLGRLLARLKRSHRIYMHRRMLHELPDELLKDIGLDRCNIDYVARTVVDRRADPTRQRQFHIA